MTRLEYKILSLLLDKAKGEQSNEIVIKIYDKAYKIASHRAMWGEIDKTTGEQLVK